MSGVTDLNTLIASMQPFLHELPYVYCSVTWDAYHQLHFSPLCTFYEQEGITIIISRQQAEENGLAFNTSWACITLKVNSSLSAIGFLAAVTDRLACVGISVNPISAYYHDHLFVPWEEKEHALAELVKLSQLRRKIK